MNLQQASQLVEDSIKGLGMDPVACRKPTQGQWNVTFKGAPIYIDVFNFPAKPENYYLQIMSPLFKVPELRREAIYRDLLEMNYDMYSCGMCIKNDWFYILTLRPTTGLDLIEVNFLLDQVGFYSNDYYNKLTFKYKDALPPPAAPTATTAGNKAPSNDDSGQYLTSIDIPVNFADIDSLEKSKKLFTDGKYAKLLLMPVELGGQDSPLNTVYVPYSALTQKNIFDAKVAAMLNSGLRLHYSAKPEYKGTSFIPSTIHITLTGDKEITEQISIW